MLSLRLQRLPKFVDLDGVMMPLPRIRGRRLVVNTLDYYRALPGSKHGKTVVVDMYRFGIDLIPWNGSPSFEHVQVAGYSLALFPAVAVRVYRVSTRVGNKEGKKTPLGYWHNFRIEHTFGESNYFGHANTKLTANELLRCYLAYADSIGLVRLVNDTGALVLPAVEWLQNETLPAACRQAGVICKLVRKNAYPFGHPWAARGSKVSIYRVDAGSLWGRKLGVVYAHVSAMIDTGRGDTAVVLSKSRLDKKALKGIFNTYDERDARGLPQSPLPLEYRGRFAGST